MIEYAGLDAAFYDSLSPGLGGDVSFYVGLAVEAAGPVLELGCGTGRITLPVAEAGVEIVGLDLSPDMLAIARSKLHAAQAEAQARVRLVQGDMRTMDLGQRFALVMIPFRAFLHLLTQEDQQQALRCIYRHLAPSGRLALNIFDPRLDLILADCVSQAGVLRRLDEGFLHPTSGNRVMVYYTRRFDPTEQLLEEFRVLEELDADGRVIDRVYTPLYLRYIHRFEMQHLLERCGFEIEALWGDWQGGPFCYGGEQIWLARRPASSGEAQG